MQDRSQIDSRDLAPLIDEAPPRPATYPREREDTRHLLGRPLRTVWTLETVLYATFVLAAILTRFAALGGRALHHDESLHAVYSWYLFVGRGYQHDPLMHGPFQFYLNALVYFLVGVSDATIRILPAIFGVIIVPLPYFLRRYLGRVGALVASFMLLVSPSFMYYSRFARNDIYVAVWTLLIVVAVFGYLRERRRAYLYLGAAALSLSWATKENTLITVFVFVSFAMFALALETVRRTIGYLLVYAVLALAAFRFLPMPKLEAPPRTPALIMREGLPQLATVILSPRIMTLLGLTVAAAVLIIWEWWSVIATRPALAQGRAPVRTPLARTMRALFTDHQGLTVAILIFIAIFVLLFTTFFTNGYGLATGTVGAVWYWLAQHDVHRGAQPLYYYLLLFPIYEPIALVLGLAGTVYFLLRRSLFTSFLIYWAFLGLAIYSWAGEKMPWLFLHVALPFMLLAAVLIDRLAARVNYRAALRRGLIFLAILTPLAVYFVFRMDQFSRPGVAGQMATPLVPALLMVALAGVYLVWLGWRRATRLFAISFFLFFSAYSVHAAWSLSYYNGATPVEMLIFTQTAPDVPKVVRDIEDISRRQTGGKSLPIVVESTQTWPFFWYLRDYSNVSYPESITSRPDAPVVIIAADSDPTVRPLLGDDYVGQRFKLRWWFPEDYRGYTPASVVRSLTHEATLKKLWRFFVYRETFSPLGSYDFIYYVRKDALPPALTAGSR